MSKGSQHGRKASGCLVSFIAILGLYQIFFAIRVFNDSGLYGNSLSLSPMLQIGLASVWTILFLTALLGLVRSQDHAVGYSAWLILSFIVYGLLRTSLFAQADYDRQRIPFLVMGTVLILIVPVWSLLKRKTQGTEQ